MARIDDYKHAREMAAQQLRQVGLDALATAGGYLLSADPQGLTVPFLDRTYAVSYPAYEFTDAADPEAEIPFQEQVLLLHYLQGAIRHDPRSDNSQWIAYREIPGAAFYNEAFVKRAINPLKGVFGQNLEGFQAVSQTLRGTPVESSGDTAFAFQLLPRIAVQLIVYAPDEDFGAEANILFSKPIAHLMSPEDAAWLAGMVVYRLCGLAARRG